MHVTQPTPCTGGDQNPAKFQGDCYYCGKKGHKKADCHKKKRDDKAKLKKADATHATGDDNKEQYEAKYPETGTVTLDGITYVARDVKPQRTIEQGPDVTLNMQEQVAVIGHGGGTASGNKILMVLDGASTVGVIEDEQHCSEVWPTDKWIGSRPEVRASPT